MELIARILVVSLIFLLTLSYILFGKENEKVKRIMDNFYVRMIFITIIVLSTVYDPLIALLLSIIFIFRYKDNSLK
jgi:hypothetical protein